MGLADIARAKQIQKQLDRLQSVQDAEERDRHAYKFATYQGKDPVDGTDIVEVDGVKTSGFKLMSNAPLEIGDRVNLRPNQQGLQRVDAKNVAPVVGGIPIDDTYPIIKLESLGLLAWTGSSFLSIGSEIARIKTNGRSAVIGELTITGSVIGYSVARQEIYLLDNYDVLIVKDNTVIATIAIPPPVGSTPYMAFPSVKYVESLDKIFFGTIERVGEILTIYTTTRSIRIVDLIARSATRIEVFVNDKDGGSFAPFPDNFNIGAYGNNQLLFDFRHGETIRPDPPQPDEIRRYYTYGFLEGTTVTIYAQIDSYETYGNPSGGQISGTLYAFAAVSGRSIFNAITEDFLATIVYRVNPSSSDAFFAVASVSGATIANHPELSTATVFADSVKGNIFGVNYSPRSLIKLAAASKEILATKNLPVNISFAPVAPYIIYCPSINRIYIIGAVDSSEDSAAASGKTTWLIPFNLSTGRFN